MKKTVIAFSFFLITLPFLGQETVSLLFFGDIMGHGGQITSASRNNGSYYDYTECFQWIEPVFRSAQLVVGNLETTLPGRAYSGYPQFGSPDALVTALKDAGVDMLVTANNHACDRRKKGIERTIDVLDSLNFLRTGTFKDSLDFNVNVVKLIEINGIQLALLNYTYGTNGIPVTSPNIVNLIDTTQMADHLDYAKSLQPDKIIVIIHWGNEYETTPNQTQKKLANFLHNKGVDIIIGSHPHVVQPFYLTKNKSGENILTAYSLGNFVSNQRYPYTDGGAMLRVELEKENNDVTITKAEYLLTWVHIPIVNGRKQYLVLPASVYEAQSIPNYIPNGYEGLFEYTKLAREVFRANINVPEATDWWPLE